MANWEGTTASSGAEVKEGQEEALAVYLAGWQVCSEDGDMATVSGGCLDICGYGDFSPYKLDDEGELPDDADADPEAFLHGLVPFLKAPENGPALVIHMVGAEKARFPLTAGEWALFVLENGASKIEFNGFKHW